MGVMEAISLSILLLAALYGCSQVIVRATRWLLRPSCPTVTLVVHLHAEETAEQQIRFAEWLSKEWRIPMVIEAEQDDETTVCIKRWFVDENSAV